ncbi:cytidylate kinase family protein [Treponema sp. TIM-1]|uniref:cytidylate kinase family protein n=1 Tax=Treponema sp. TIM-1 TaxID=2898417 RepID=UPI00397F24D1
MAIITISRELAAMGDETAHELAKLLNYRFVDKLSLEERIKSYGVADRKFEKYDERKPSLFASLSQDRDDYLHYLKTAIFAEAGSGNCVFIGRGAGAVFRNIPGVLSVFLVAPGEIRNERVKSYFHCDDRRARQIIEQSDQNRVGFHRYFFDIDWRSPDNYHLTLNTGYLSPAACAELIKNLLEKLISEEIEIQNLRKLRELILSQRVVHHILYEKEIPIHFLESSSSENAVTLYGVASSQALVEAAVSSAREVPPVADVRSEIQVVQEYSVMP